MSCNGCRVLRKGCSESCILRPCLCWIDGAEAQGHATIFVAKFFGRAGLLSFISSVPEPQRPALFQSLLFEACGRTVSPVHGAVGLLWSGNWRICQAAVETVLRGGTIRAIPELLAGTAFPPISTEESSEADDGSCIFEVCNNNSLPTDEGDQARSLAPRQSKRKNSSGECPVNLGLGPNSGILNEVKKGEYRTPGTPSRTSEESVTMTSCFESGSTIDGQPPMRLLNLF